MQAQNNIPMLLLGSGNTTATPGATFYRKQSQHATPCQDNIANAAVIHLAVTVGFEDIASSPCPEPHPDAMQHDKPQHDSFP
jgi:hypothetical protein